MKKIIKEVSNGIAQITTVDERWYVKDGKYFVPAVTWICRYYPKGVPFMKWLAEKGWDEAEAIKQAAGDKGSKVHYAIQDLIAGNTVAMESKYTNPSTGQPEELSVEEYEALYWFSKFWESVKPKTLASELTLFAPHKQGCPNALLNPSAQTPCACVAFAGTIDWLGELDGELWLIDFKTSQNIWKEYELQVSAYKHLVEVNGMKTPAHLGILQVPYHRNKTNKWKLTELEDKYALFSHTYATWKEEAAQTEPLRKDFPVTLSLSGGLLSEKVENQNQPK